MQTKFTKKEKEKIRRVVNARKKMHKAGINLDLQIYRRKQAEKGNILKALFGKPPIKKRKKKR